MNNHYKILGCNRNDSLETIKANYRRLSLRFHPDKNNGESETFIQINKAYHSILNETSLVTSFKDNARHYLIMLYLLMKPKNIQLSLSVSFEDVYNGVIKKINYSRYLKGRKIKDYIYVHLMNFKESYIMEGYGDENPLTKKCGDLELSFKIDYKEHTNVYINNLLDLYDVSHSIKITLYEYYYGFDEDIFFMNDKINVSQHVPLKDGMMMHVKNKGLPYVDEKGEELRGNLLILFELDLPGMNENVDEQFKTYLYKNFHCK